MRLAASVARDSHRANYVQYRCRELAAHAEKRLPPRRACTRQRPLALHVRTGFFPPLAYRCFESAIDGDLCRPGHMAC
jgi:hypothetical protein